VHIFSTPNILQQSWLLTKFKSECTGKIIPVLDEIRATSLGLIGNGRIAQPFFTSALDGEDGHLHAPTALSLGKEPL
jgi:hypothetical protein